MRRAGWAMVVVGAVAVLASVVRRPHRKPVEATAAPHKVVVWDWCDICGAEATHEMLVGGDEPAELAGIDALGGGTAMVGCYCPEHAPPAAIRVR